MKNELTIINKFILKYIPIIIYLYKIYIYVYISNYIKCLTSVFQSLNCAFFIALMYIPLNVIIYIITVFFNDEILNRLFLKHYQAN